MARTFKNTFICFGAVAVAAISLCRCTHPFEEGMTGSFPSSGSDDEFELLTGGYISVPATGSREERTKTIEIRTGSGILTDVDYLIGSSGWISITDKETNSSTKRATVTFTASENTSSDQRSADIIISSAFGGNSVSVHVTQSGNGEYPDEEETYYGDLYLMTQEDVDNFRYTCIEGQMIIGNNIYGGYMTSYNRPDLYFDGSDITDISNLSRLTSVTGGIIMVSNANLYEAWPLCNVSTPFIEFTDMPSGAVRTYAENGGNVPELYITSNSGNFYDMSFVRNMYNLEYLMLRGNMIDNFIGIGDATNLQRLDLYENAISYLDGLESSWSLRDIVIAGDGLLQNINVLADMTELSSVYLSNLNISESQVNYIMAANPDLSISMENLNGSTYLTASVPETNMSSAILQFCVYNMYDSDITEYGVIVRDENAGFDFQSRQPAEWPFVNGQEYQAEYQGLAYNSGYRFWSYAIDTNGSIHLSPECSFRTSEEELYSFDITLTAPTFDNTGEYVNDYPYMKCLALKTLSETETTTDNIFMENTGGDTWQFSTGSGMKNLLFTNVSEQHNAIIGFGGDENETFWSIIQTGNSGLGQDVLIAATQVYVSGYMNESLNMQRPVSRISIILNFTGNYPTDNITDIQTTVTNCQSECVISTYTRNISYGGNTDNVFTGFTRDGNTLTTVDKQYVFPNADGISSDVNFTFYMDDGSQVSTSATLKEVMNANNDYTFEFDVDWHQTGASFTIDSIQDVTDTIEF